MGGTKYHARDQCELLIQQAMKAVQGGLKGGVPAAVEIYGVPRTTLYYWLAGTCRSQQVAHVPQQCLLESEEKAIVKWCFDIDHIGFPARLDNVREMALHLEGNRVGGAIEPLGKNWIT